MPRMRLRSPVRAGGAFSLACLYLCLVLLALSALAYPGGSWAEPDAEGFRPFVNYWCDLMRTEAVNGRPNGTSAALARAAFGALALSLSSYWWAAASLFRSPRAARWAMASGAVCSICTAFLALMPYDTAPRAHVVTTLCAGGSGTLATALTLLASLDRTRPTRARHVWGAALIVAATVNIVVYADIVLWNPRESAVLPGVQKLATLFLALWMTATLIDARAPGRGLR